jgi:hypothetical protein
MTLEDYPKEAILKDGTGVSMRPLQQGDENLLVEMFKRFSEGDLWFIEGNVTDSGWIQNWVKDVDLKKMMSIVAVLGDEIIACGNLKQEHYEAERHVGKIRISVVPSFREKHLATWMLLDLINLAIEAGLETLVMPLVEDRDSPLIRSIEKLEFSKEAVLKNYVKDRAGSPHNLALMIKRLHRVWEPLR